MYQWIILLYEIIHIIIVHLFRRIVHLLTIPAILTRLLTEIYNKKVETVRNFSQSI